MQTVKELEQAGYVNASSLTQFGQLRQGDHFISPEGSWCIKKTSTKAVMMDTEDSVYKQGDLVSFYDSEVIEPVPETHKAIGVLA